MSSGASRQPGSMPWLCHHAPSHGSRATRRYPRMCGRAQTRPLVASALMVASGLAGAVAISLFTIDSWYALALPFWLAGALLAVTANGTAAPGPRPRPPPAGRSR
jgi:hypothetical protein